MLDAGTLFVELFGLEAMLGSPKQQLYPLRFAQPVADELGLLAGQLVEEGVSVLGQD